MHMKKTAFVLIAIVSLGLAPFAGAATLTDSARESEVTTISVERDATASAMIGVVGKPFILDGTKSQDDGVVRTFVWRQVGGPVVSLSKTVLDSATFTPQVAGTYVFELRVTDDSGMTTVAQKTEVQIGVNKAPVAGSVPPGDPDFDLLKAAPPPASIGDVDRDGADDALIKEDRLTIGDPDFNLLSVDLDDDAVEDLRSDAQADDSETRVTVRGWDTDKKEEVVAHPEEVKTPEDLRVYAEAVALRDGALKGIKIKENLLEVESHETGKLFRFIPVGISMKITVDLNAGNASQDRVKVKLPWWHFLATKDVSAADVMAGIGAGLDVAVGEDAAVLALQDVIQRDTKVLQLVSNVMKTRHDTAKNSIGNIR